jgi:argininosuccinate lyase
LNSLDAVSDRDYVIEFVFCLTLPMIHLSRFSSEVIYWLSTPVDLARISDAYCTGSSIMPQKKNPDTFELMRGKTGRAIGNLINILTTMKAQNLAYNKDNQEDKLVTFETTRVLTKSLEITRNIIKTIKPNTTKIKTLLNHGFATATDLADQLVYLGLTFRDAHEITSRVVRTCSLNKRELKGLHSINLSQWVSVSLGHQIHTIKPLEPRTSIFMKNLYGNTSPKHLFRIIHHHEKEKGHRT